MSKINKELKPTGSNSVFLIEKGWIDPMENRNAAGYNPFCYVNTEEDAKLFCESQGYWTVEDCWIIHYSPDKKMPKYRYSELKSFS